VALLPINILPGLYLNRTPYSAKTRWMDANCVRWRDGVPQQIGGWRAASGGTGITGVPRCAISWRPGNQHGKYMAVGTNEGVFLYDGGHVSSITPAAYTAGRVDSQPGAGYGGGLYGAGAFGVPTYGSSVVLEAAWWSMDMWGDFLVAVGHDGVVCQYDGTGVLAPIVGAPTARALVVTDDRILMLLGAGGIPNRIEWSDQENNAVYTPSATNKAGGFTLNTVSQLAVRRPWPRRYVRVERHRSVRLLPDLQPIRLWLRRLGQNCGACSPNAAVVVGEVPYWMGVDGFYKYDGQVQRLDCDVQDFVFGDLDNGIAADFNIEQKVKVHVRFNTLFDEVWFSYPSGLNSECNRVVTFNIKNGTWSRAGLTRTAWCDRGAFALPMGMDAAGSIFEHEVGRTGDGQQIDSYVESAPFELGNGDNVQQIRSFWPDMRQGSGKVALLLKLQMTPRGMPVVKGPIVFDAQTERIYLSCVARQLAVRLEGFAPGDYWELGTPRVEITAGGGR
jgi:hypothetical protein